MFYQNVISWCSLSDIETPEGEYMNTTEFKIDFQKSGTIDDFNKYSGTDFKKAKKFLDLTLQNIPEWNDYRFKLFYSGYAGFIIIDEYGDKIGYLMYDKNKYGLEDATEGKGWYLKPAQGKESLCRDWIRIVERLAQQRDFKPGKIRM